MQLALFIVKIMGLTMRKTAEKSSTKSSLLQGTFVAALPILSALLSGCATNGSAHQADAVYRNGTVYTVDAGNSVQQALAVQDGRIIFVGSNEAVDNYIGANTRVTDLHGRTLMPGLIDGHMHPIMGGGIEISCNLHYVALTQPETLKQIQSCLDSEKNADPNSWLNVYAWFRQAMLPAGTDLSRVDLDQLKTSRPVTVLNFDGHSLVANSRAIQLAGVTDRTPNPSDGVITHDVAGHVTGVFEDGGAISLITDHIPQPAPEMAAAIHLASARAALKVMSQQGVTSFLDAMGTAENIETFKTLQTSGELTARAHFAPMITPYVAKDPVKAVADVKTLAHKNDQGVLVKEPGITVRNVKIFMDGVIQAPAMTGALLKPYFVNHGSKADPHWVPGTNSGALYFEQSLLTPLLLELARNGIDPHLHTDGDGAVHVALNSIQAMRTAFPDKDIRPGLAHNETIAPSDYARYKELNAIPVLSFQWGKPAPDTIDGVRDYIGAERFPFLETAGKFDQAGVRIAFGSDWPVNELDEWFALKVAVTRTARPGAEARYAGRLGDDPGLTPAVALRAATINAAYELHQDDLTGSLEVGKFADMIILDRNPTLIPHEEIANVKVLMTIVGGKVVYKANDSHL